MRFPTDRPRSRWLRLAVLLAAVAQLALAFAPLAEARGGAPAQAHVEQTGTQFHAGHNEADCAACIATHLLSRIERPARLVPPAVREHRAVSGAPQRHLANDPSSLRFSRAPPSVV